MDEKLVKKILTDLSIEENTETEIISLYQSLLDLGIDNCLEEGERADFRHGMDVLQNESMIHKELIQGIKSKY